MESFLINWNLPRLVRFLIKRFLCRLVFTQYKNMWLVRMSMQICGNTSLLLRFSFDFLASTSFIGCGDIFVIHLLSFLSLRIWRGGLPAHLRTRSKDAPSSFHATRDVMLSASHVAATTLLHHSPSLFKREPRSECSHRRSLVRQWRTQKIFVGGVWFKVIWWLFVFGVRCLRRHNLTSFPCFQTNVCRSLLT